MMMNLKILNWLPFVVGRRRFLPGQTVKSLFLSCIKRLDFFVEEQLQLAIINQVYFHEKTPEEIFGSICIEHVFDMINSIDVRNNGTTSMVVSRTLI